MDQVLDVAIDRLHELLGGDGVRFQVAHYVPGTRLDLRLDLAGVECADCVMPREYLTDLVTDTVREILADPSITVALDDPRVSNEGTKMTTVGATIKILNPSAFAAGVGNTTPTDGNQNTLDSLHGKRIGVRIDEMWESWEWTASVWETLLTEAGATPVLWKAPTKGDESQAEPSGLREFIASIDGAIVGLCNCGSCTFWSIHDALATIAAGLPTVVVSTKNFTRLARLLADKGGQSHIQLVELPFPLQGRPRDEVESIAREHFGELLSQFGVAEREPSLSGGAR